MLLNPNPTLSLVFFLKRSLSPHPLLCFFVLCFASHAYFRMADSPQTNQPRRIPRSISVSSGASASSSLSANSSSLTRCHSTVITSPLTPPAATDETTPDSPSAQISPPVLVSHSSFSQLDSASMFHVSSGGGSKMRSIAKRLEDVVVPGPPMRDIWLKDEKRTARKQEAKRIAKDSFRKLYHVDYFTLI